MQKRVIFEVSGMSCAHCADTIYKSLDKKGVIGREVSYPENKAVIDFDPSHTNEKELTRIIHVYYKNQYIAF